MYTIIIIVSTDQPINNELHDMHNCMFCFVFQNFNTLQSVCIQMDASVLAQWPIRLQVSTQIIHHKLQTLLLF